MAENEILDLGHALRWRRTRQALTDPHCREGEVIAAACNDLEEVCRRLPAALRKEPLGIMLGPALGSPAQAQAVVASFKEKQLASIVQDAIKLARSADPGKVAASAAKRIIEVLVDQFRIRTGKTESYRSYEERNRLVAEAANSFAAYESSLRVAIEDSLRGGPVRRFKPFRSPAPRMSAQQVANLPLPSPRPESPRAQ